MVSGHVNRANRPNTWLHRPTLQSEDFSCQPGAVHHGPNAKRHDAALMATEKRTLDYAGATSHFDPKRTSRRSLFGKA